MLHGRQIRAACGSLRWRPGGRAQVRAAGGWAPQLQQRAGELVQGRMPWQNAHRGRLNPQGDPAWLACKREGLPAHPCLHKRPAWGAFHSQSHCRFARPS